MRRIQLLLPIATTLSLLGSQAPAADPLELVNSFLNDGEATEVVEEASTIESPSGILVPAGFPVPEDGSIRVAQRQRSVLRLSDEKVNVSKKSASVPSLTTSSAAANLKKAETEKKRIESGIDRKMSALERALAREEKKLESRFVTLSKKREVALKKGDEKMLKQIETLETKAVADFDRKVQRLLSSAIPGAGRSPIQQSVGNRKGSTNPTWNRNNPSGRPGMSQKAAGSAEKPAAPPKRRRLRLWPFGS